ncbi:sigma-54-dependent Fis family transcriptional regulator [Dinghuibacter silviterrae]|uniref:sigma-54-dependent Fis family transcriptional regulator n=1 Tax=Dinghuibacter silviterrae TaxID=1539049 RepID=UPI001FE27F02|nr:sigma 54-interacting transcriptional regulator [Dinghuibacter silviterrae]
MPYGLVADSPITEHPDYEHLLRPAYSFSEELIKKIFSTPEGIVCSFEEAVSLSSVRGVTDFQREVGVREFLFLPIYKGADAIGIFTLVSMAAGTFVAEERVLLEGIAREISVTLSNILAWETIERKNQLLERYKRQLEEENYYLQEQIKTHDRYQELIGTSPGMQQIYQLISEVAFTSSTVLILGETGTGKELVARAIHQASPRKDKRMVKVNCSALPVSLIESELFGHERGSFTGATEQRIGKFELANNGTLFLDEIGELSADLQVKLLRAIQEKEIERIGGKTTIKVNVRIVTATNRDLYREVQEGRFRSDLYYRLHVFPMTIPPLRERKEDIPALVGHFIQRYARNTGKQVTSVSKKVMEELMGYDWPGNIRELEHLVERSVILAKGSVIKDMHIPLGERKGVEKVEKPVRTLVENEREHILWALRKCNGKVFGHGGAAELLDVHVSTLNSKMRKLGIKKEQVFK